MELSLASIVAMVEVHLGVAGVTPEQRLVEDLGGHSLDLVNLIGEVEDRFGVQFTEPELDRVSTVGDLLAVVEGATRRRP